VIPVLSKDPQSPFPAIETALEYPPGLLAVGGDLSPSRLLNAYSHGIFPWYSDDEPILWWSPAPRCVIYPAQVHISRRLKRRYNQGSFKITANQAFDEVVSACATSRSDNEGTWINSDMQMAYTRLHKLAVAHSVEVWRDDELAGGVYGLAIGSVFFGESMFSRVTDASKVALVALCQQLQAWQFSLLDCQISNPHLRSMGAIEISRTKFQQHLDDAGNGGHWQNNFSSTERW
jgi:leucyl/phenylalanyl-tRNA--protein transferase